MKIDASEAKTIPAKYIFIDIVGFTHGRSVEAQSDIIHSLNDLVRQTIDSHDFPEDSLILLPTGIAIPHNSI